MKLKKDVPSCPEIDASVPDITVPFLNNTNVKASGIVTFPVSVVDVHKKTHTADVVFAVVDLDYYDAILNNHACKVQFKLVHYNAANWETYFPNPLKDSTDDNAPEHLEDLYPNAATDFIANLLDITDPKQATVRTTPVAVEALPTIIQVTLSKYQSSVFTPDATFTGLSIPPIHIDTAPDLPAEIYSIPRPPRKDISDIVKRTLAAYERVGLHSKSTSCYSSPIIPIPKFAMVDGIKTLNTDEIRIAVDYNRSSINKYLLSPSHPIPLIKDIVEGLSKFTLFSDIDMMKAYRQVPIDADSSKLLSYVSVFGQYQPHSLPEGIRPACHIFQALMDQLFHDFILLGWLFVYFDNIWIGAESPEQLNDRIQMLLERCKKYNIKLGADKCTWCTDEVTCLGYIIRHNSIKIHPSRVSAIANLPAPTSKDQLHSFMGSLVQCAKYIANYSSLVAPLYSLLAKSATFTWEQSHQDIYEELKHMLSDLPSLTFPDPVNQQLILRTDASNIGIGGTLLQRDSNGVETIIAFCSQKLSTPATKWSTYELELYSIIYSLKQWQDILHGVNFIIETDHKNLTYLMDSDIPKVRRWISYMNSFDFVIFHIPGKLNIVSDMLSRLHPMVADTVTTSSDDPSITDEVILQSYIIPCHEGDGHCAHNSEQKTYEAVLNLLQAQKITVPRKYNLLKNIHEYIQQCSICQKEKANLQKLAKEYKSLSNFSSYSVVGLDSVGPFPVDIHGNKYVLVVRDHCDRMLKMFPIPDRTTEHYLYCLLNAIADWGIPRAIRTDNDKSFTSDLCKRFDALLNIKHTTTLPYTPTGNSIIERSNKDSIRRLRMLIQHHNILHSWSKFLPIISYVMNNAFCRTIGMQPYRLRYGDRYLHRYNQFVDLQLDDENLIQGDSSGLIESINDSLKLCYEIAQLTQNKEIYKLLCKNPLPDDTLKVGHYVVANQPDDIPPHKFAPRFRGPYKVVRIENSTISVKHVLTLKESNFDISHVKRFYCENENHALDAVKLDDNSFIISEVLDHRGDVNSRKSMEFLVKFTDDSLPDWISFNYIKGLKVFSQYCSSHQLSDLLLSDSDYQVKIKNQVKATLLKEREEKAQLLQDQKLQAKQAKQLVKEQNLLAKKQAKEKKKELKSIKDSSNSVEKANLNSNISVKKSKSKILKQKRKVPNFDIDYKKQFIPRVRK